ncbi:MAG: DUF6653 family protein [Oceanospirillaceae bacterium]
MDITKLSEKLMWMDDASWQRHSNPWSVYTRFLILPLMSLAFWSRQWLGDYSLIPILLSFIWIWVNPRMFAVPSQTDNWASMGTFGERIYLNRNVRPIPQHHMFPAMLLQLMSGLGLPVFIYGLYSLNIWAVVLGNLWIIVLKLGLLIVWFGCSRKRKIVTFNQ